MQGWFVLILYAIIGIICIFTRFVILLRWWSSFVLALVIVYIIIICVTPEISSSNESIDVFYEFLYLLLTIASPILFIIYIASQAFLDRIDKVCVG